MFVDHVIVIPKSLSLAIRVIRVRVRVIRVIIIIGLGFLIPAGCQVVKNGRGCWVIEVIKFLIKK